ncbi:MAG: hypothetical protein U0X91_25920 [Spirosomataceae bacterium]
MKIFLYLLLSVMVLQNCSVLNDHRVEITLPKEYEACCGVQPVDFKHSNGSIYMPNVFTPNGDGINDLFYPFISGEILEIQGFTIFSAVGDTVIFTRPTVLYDRLKEFAWNGLRNDGTVYKGRFKYGMRVVSKDLKLRLLEGEACSVICEPGTAELKIKKSCFFPSQAGKQEKAGKVDSTLSNSEKDCLK